MGYGLWVMGYGLWVMGIFTYHPRPITRLLPITYYLLPITYLLPLVPIPPLFSMYAGAA